MSLQLLEVVNVIAITGGLMGFSCLLIFSHIPTHYGTVSVPRQESSSSLFQIIWQNNYMILTVTGNHLVGHHGADIAVCVVKGLCLVGLAVSRPDLAISTSHDDRTLRWPGKAGHCGRLDELVADHLLLPKVVADLVYKHNVVRLRNRQSVGFRAEGKALLRMVGRY